jgi:hypothetical protein
MPETTREMIAAVRAWEQNAGWIPKTLTEGSEGDAVQIKDGKIIFNRTAAQERELQEAVKEVALHETRLPESSGKAKDEPTPDPLRDAIFGRLGLDRASYAPPAKKPTPIHEAPKDAQIVIAEGTHRKLLGQSIERLPDDVHVKLARAL